MLIDRRTRAALAIAAAAAGLLAWQLHPWQRPVFCEASNGEQWVAALEQHPIGALGEPVRMLDDQVAGGPLVVTRVGGTDRLEVWPPDGPKRQLAAAPEGWYVTSLAAGDGWAAFSTARSPNGRWLGRGKGYSQERLEAVQLATGKQVHLADRAVGRWLDRPVVFGGGVWWSTHDRVHGTSHRFDLRTGARTEPSRVVGHAPQVLADTRGLFWQLVTGAVPGEQQTVRFIARTPLPPLVQAAKPADPVTDGTTYAWWSRAGLAWWQPGMTEVGLLPYRPGDVAWGPAAVDGVFVWVNRATEALQDGYLDLRTGAIVETHSDGDLRDPVDWMSPGPHLVPSARGPGPTDYYRIVPSELPELRC